MNIDCKANMMPVEAPVSRVTTSVVPGGERAPRERLGKGQEIRVKDEVQHVVNGLATLAKNGDIDQAQSSAAERWYRDYVMGVVGARDPETSTPRCWPGLRRSGGAGRFGRGWACAARSG